MPQSLAKVIVHIVYSTKNRTPWLKDAKLRSELYAYNATILKNVDSPAIVIGGVEDHIHILALLSRKVAIMDVILQSKTETSKWIKKQGPRLQDFQWQAGYDIFSVSESNVGAVKPYIERQAEHHQRMSFQDEFRILCQKHQIEIDERFAWD